MSISPGLVRQGLTPQGGSDLESPFPVHDLFGREHSWLGGSPVPRLQHCSQSVDSGGAKCHIIGSELQVVLLSFRHWQSHVKSGCHDFAGQLDTNGHGIHTQSGRHKLVFALTKGMGLLLFADQLRVFLLARHIPEKLNVLLLTVFLSRRDQVLPTDWLLHQAVFVRSCLRRNTPEIDLFITR